MVKIEEDKCGLTLMTGGDVIESFGPKRRLSFVFSLRYNRTNLV